MTHVAIFTFSPTTGESLRFLPIRIGDRLNIASKSENWAFGSRIEDDGRTGVFPLSYVRPIDQQCLNRNHPFLTEINETLTKWWTSIKKKYLETFEQDSILMDLMRQLRIYHQKLKLGNLPNEENESLVRKIAETIDHGNHLLGLGMHIRNENMEVLKIESLSIISAFRKCEEANAKISNPETTDLESKKYNLIMHVHQIDFKIPYDCELEIAIKDPKLRRIIAEPLVLKWSKIKKGFMHDRCQVIFSELCDKKAELMISMNVVKMSPIEGNAKSESKSLLTPEECRQIHAYGEFNLSESLKDIKDKEKRDASFALICEDTRLSLTRNQAKKSEIVHFDSKLVISITMQALMGSIEKVREKHADSFVASIPSLKRIHFNSGCEFMNEPRNEIYFHFMASDFHLIKTPRIESRLTVVDNDGNVQDSIEIMTPDESLKTSTYRTKVLVGEERPKFNEIVKIRLPEVAIQNLNLRILFYNRKPGKSDKGPIALASIPIIQDYKLVSTSDASEKDEESWIYKLDSGKYDDANIAQAFKDLSLQDKKVPTSKLTYRLDVLSNVHTKEARLLPILSRWRDIPNDLKDCLQEVMLINGQAEEIVKFLPHVFDELLEMADVHPELGRQIFNVIVWIVRRCEALSQFKQVFGCYTEGIYHVNAFNFLLDHLYEALKQSFESYCASQAGDLQREVISLLKSSGYLSRMVVHSREAWFKLNELRYLDGDFPQKIVSLLTLLMDIIQTSPDPFIRNCAIKYLAYFISPIIDHQMYNLVDLARFVANLLHSLPTTRDRNDAQSLKDFLFSFIKEIVGTDLFASKDCRSVLQPKVLDQICQELDDTEVYERPNRDSDNQSYVSHYITNVDSGAQILNDLLEKLFPFNAKGYLQHGTREELVEIVTKCIRPAIQQASILLERGDLGNHLSVLKLLMALLDKLSAPIFCKYFNQAELQEYVVDKVDIWTQLLQLFQNLLAKNPFNKEWYQLRFVFYRLVHKQTSFVKAAIRGLPVNQALDRYEYVYCIKELFKTSMAFLDHVSTDEMGIYADTTEQLRFSMASMLRSLWFTHNTAYKLEFMEEFFSKTLLLSVKNTKEIRKAILPILADIYYTKASFKDAKFHEEFIAELDSTLLICRDSKTFSQQLCTMLKDRCQPDIELHRKLEKPLQDIEKVLALLIDYNEAQADCQENKMLCTVRLLKFYASIYHRLYLTYLLKLHDMHIQLANLVEAALVLKRISESVEWKKEILNQSQREILTELKYDRVDTQLQLKERLYLNIVNLLDEGEHWERAVEFLEELCNVYKTVFMDYKKLSDIFRSIAELYDKIRTKIRMESYYFLVAFYGRGFPDYLSNTKFVFRGKKLEMFQNFKERMLSSYYGAKFVDSVEDQSNTAIASSNEKHIQIIPIFTQVDTSPEMDDVAFNPLIKWYQKLHRVSKFEQSRRDMRPNTKWTKLESNDATKLWIAKRTFETSHQLPDILEFAKVAHELGQEPMNPVEVAIQEIQKTNNTLLETALMVHNGSTELLISLGGKIRGILQADVGGGIRNYEVFVSNKAEAVCSDPELDDIDELKEVLSRHLSIVEFSLYVHSTHPDLINAIFHNALVTFCEEYVKRTTKVFGITYESWLPDGMTLKSIVLESANDMMQQSPLSHRTVSNASFDRVDSSVVNFSRVSEAIRNTMTRSKPTTPAKRSLNERSESTTSEATLRPNFRKPSGQLRASGQPYKARRRESSKAQPPPVKPPLPPRKTMIHSTELIRREAYDDLDSL